MKIFCWISIMVLMLGIAPSQLAAQGANGGKNVLKNQDVIDLLNTGLSYDVVVAKIKSSPCQFDTSTEALKNLKAAGVSDAVILAMVEASNKPADQPAATDATASGGPSSDVAHVRVYRPKFLPGSNFNPPIYIDAKEVAKLSNGHRFSVRVTPGHHVITSDDKSSEISIDAKGGEEFYISVEERPGGFLKGRGKMTMMAVEQGRPEYKLEKPLEDDKKTAKDMIEDDADTDTSGGASDKPAGK